jgi:hypothetical protein
MGTLTILIKPVAKDNVVDGEKDEIIFLAYFKKMKVGLSNHESVCLCVCPSLITFEPIRVFYEIL